ncbi:MAG: acetolactate synthase large subunit [Paracoccaceae bacterium]
MNGATSLVRTLLASGVEVCFANPGTSEMHFVAALDAHPDMRCILCLFEGGATGAADGYYRMTGEIAVSLLHLAPGFANGFANLHNARKARSAMVTVMGEHATYHRDYESPLKGDTLGVARAVSHWVTLSPQATTVAQDGAAAITAARSQGGQVATLILPADTAWNAADQAAVAAPPPPLSMPTSDAIRDAADLLRLPGAVLMVDGPALRRPLSDLASAIAAATGARLMCPYFVSRVERGAGAVPFEPLRYPVDENVSLLADATQMVLLGATSPAAFFAYPGKPSSPVPDSCAVTHLCSPEMDVAITLQALADHLGAKSPLPVTPLALPDAPTGPITLEKLGNAIAHVLPANTVVVEEAITSARPLIDATRNARPHDWLCLMGGAIGDGLPVAVGAAVGAPDRKVVLLQADGSAMYTLQCLWTMARERLDVVVIILANDGYRTLHREMANVGIDRVGANALRMFDVVEPRLDWVALAKGHGVQGVAVQDMAQFNAAFAHALAHPGPHLIEVPCPT